MSKTDAKNHLDGINKHLAALGTETAEALIRRNDLGAKMCFDDLADDFAGVLDMARDIGAISLEGFPLQILSELNGALGGIVGSLSSIKAFDQATPNAAPTRSSLLQQFSAQHTVLVKAAAPVIQLGLIRSLRATDTLETFRSEIHAAQEARTKIEDALRNSEAALEKIRGISAATGVVAHAQDFKEQAGRHHAAAWAWMVVTVVLGIGTAILAYCLFRGSLKGTDADWTGPLAVRAVAFRLVLLSFFTYFVAWGARNYRANRHNDIVNTHRKIALSTFETFAKAAEADKDTKNAVLLQATQAIFSAQRSGYLDKEPEVGPQNTVVEILRSSSPQK